MNDTQGEDDFEGELLTIKGLHDFDAQEQTIRPKRPKETPGHTRSKSSIKMSTPGPKSPSKMNKRFELPARLDLTYREQSVEDFSDLFAGDEHVFDRRVNQVIKKVSLVLCKYATADISGLETE